MDLIPQRCYYEYRIGCRYMIRTDDKAARILRLILRIDYLYAKQPEHNACEYRAHDCIKAAFFV